MSLEPARKFTMTDLRGARESGKKIPMLTCYDYTTARLMQEAGVPALLVGDSAANVILGHPTTLPIPLDFLIELTAAVRRGAPNCLLLGDMPFGSYQASSSEGAKNVMRMVKLSGCDCVKVEVAENHDRLVMKLADAGVAVMAHLGLRPQAVGLTGGYKARGQTAVDAREIVRLATKFEKAGAAAILLEAVSAETAEAVVEAVSIPVIGCGAGSACHGHVFVTQDALGFTSHRPRFVPMLGDIATPLKACLSEYVRMVTSGQYPGPEHQYEMRADEKVLFKESRNRKI